MAVGRFGSRPGDLPKTRDPLTEALKDAIDNIGDELEPRRSFVGPGGKRSKRTVTWQAERGRPGTVWIVNARYSGEWSYPELHKRLTSRALQIALPPRQLVVIALLVREYDDDGEVQWEGWVTVAGGIQPWLAAIKRAIGQVSPNVRGSLAKRYPDASVVQVDVQIASHARETFLEKEEREAKDLTLKVKAKARKRATKHKPEAKTTPKVKTKRKRR